MLQCVTGYIHNFTLFLFVKMTLKIAGIKIQNLKNIEFVDLKLEENFQIVAGNNGAGKSTLVEGIFM